METHKNNTNKAQRQESLVPERRGTEFLLEPPEKRPNEPHKNPGPWVTRAKPEVVTPSGNNNLDSGRKFVNKYFTNSPPQPLTIAKPRKMRPIVPTDKISFKYQKPSEQATPERSGCNTPQHPSPSRVVPHRARDIPRPPPEPPNITIPEPDRPKTPGRRQIGSDDDFVVQTVIAKQPKNVPVESTKQKALAEVKDGVEAYHFANKGASRGKKFGRVTDIDKRVMYIFTPPADEKVVLTLDSDESLQDQPGFVQNINFEELAETAQKKAERFADYRDDGLESYVSNDMVENSPMAGRSQKNLTFDTTTKMPEKPMTNRTKIAKSKSPRTRIPKNTEYDKEFEVRPLTARPVTAVNRREDAEYAESGTSVAMARPHKHFETEHVDVFTDKATLRVNNLDDSLECDDLMALFPKATSVTYPIYDRSGPPTMKPTRYCYVLFNDVRDAKDAFEKMDSVLAKGMILDIEYRHYNS